MYETGTESIISQIDSVAGIVAAEEVSEAAADQPLQAVPPSNQLTLSFQGEVYIFDSVPPERVQAVLLLLGGQELPSSDVSGMQLSNNLPRSSSNPQRIASLMRYKEKRKNLCFERKVLYTVRKEVASRMKRKKGQFVSSKTNSEEVVSPSSSCDAAHINSQEETISSCCHNCGTSKHSTPMMRRGPAGPRSLCNACGLMWANKGTLRSLQPSATPVTQNPSIYSAEQNDANNSGSSNGQFYCATENDPKETSISGRDVALDYDPE